MTAQRFYLPREQVFTNLGVIGAGWKLYTYETGTTTPLATYSNTALSVANANPTIADSAGRLGDIFVNDLKLYKAILKDENDNTIWTADPVDPKTFTLADFDPRPTSFWGTTAGTASAYTLDADPDVSAYDSQQTFFFACHLDCSAAPTMAVDGLSALNIKKYDGDGAKLALEALDILAGQRYEATNDGTDIIVLNPEKPARLKVGNGGELTVATGEITLTSSRHSVDTESDAASDDLDTISNGSTDQVIFLYAENASRIVTLKNGTGNIVTNNGEDIPIHNLNTPVVLQYDGTNWKVIGRGDKILQIQESAVSTYGSTTVLVPYDNTAPQKAEGTSVTTIAFTPKSANSTLYFEATGMVDANTSNHRALLLVNTVIDDCLAVNSTHANATGRPVTIPLIYSELSASTTARIYDLRYGSESGTSYINGSSTSALYGGKCKSTLRITEIL